MNWQRSPDPQASAHDDLGIRSPGVRTDDVAEENTGQREKPRKLANGHRITPLGDAEQVLAEGHALLAARPAAARHAQVRERRAAVGRPHALEGRGEGLLLLG